MSTEKYNAAAIDGAQMMMTTLRKDRDSLCEELNEARLEIASLQARVNECGAGAGCCWQAARIEALEARLEAVGAGAGGVGAAPWCEGCTPENCSGCPTSGFVPAAQLQPVAWAIFAENGHCRMWTQNKGHADVAAKDTGLPLTALYAAPQPAAQALPMVRAAIAAQQGEKS